MSVCREYARKYELVGTMVQMLEILSGRFMTRKFVGRQIGRPTCGKSVAQGVPCTYVLPMTHYTRTIAV